MSSLPVKSIVILTLILTQAWGETCVPGKYQVQNSTNTRCQDCNIGQYSKHYNATMCNHCPHGKYQVQKGQVGCHNQGIINDTVLLSVLSWFWWCVNLFFYKYVQRGSLYIRIIWLLNFICLFTTGVLTLSTSDESITTAAALVIMLTVFVIGGCGVFVWCKLIQETYLQHNASRPSEEEGMAMTPIVNPAHQKDDPHTSA